MLGVSDGQGVTDVRSEANNTAEGLSGGNLVTSIGWWRYIRGVPPTAPVVSRRGRCTIIGGRRVTLNRAFGRVADQAVGGGAEGNRRAQFRQIPRHQYRTWGPGGWEEGGYDVCVAGLGVGRWGPRRWLRCFEGLDRGGAAACCGSSGRLLGVNIVAAGGGWNRRGFLRGWIMGFITGNSTRKPRGG